MGREKGENRRGRMGKGMREVEGSKNHMNPCRYSLPKI